MLRTVPQPPIMQAMADQLLTRQPTDEEALAFLADQSGKRFS